MKRSKYYKRSSRSTSLKFHHQKDGTHKKKKLKHKKCSSHSKRLRQLRDGATYHVTARANRGEMIFDSFWAKELFVITLEKAKLKYKFQFTEFSIMDNHLHFLIKPAHNTSLSRIMQWILSVFAMRWNKIMGYSGHVWKARFHSRIIESVEDYENVVEYIRKNPVKAKLVKKPTHWKYSSAWFRRHRKWCRKRNRGSLLDPPRLDAA